MDIEELRGIELFTGLTDDQLAELADGWRRGALRDRRRAVHRGRARRRVVGAARRARSTWSARSGARTSWWPGWTCPAGGPAASGPGTTTASTWRPVAARRPGRVLRLDAPRLRELVEPLVPARGAPDRRAPPHGPLDRVHRPAARRAGHAGHARGRARARDQQPRGRGEPHGRRPRPELRRAARGAHPAGPATTSRRRSSPPSTSSAARPSPPRTAGRPGARGPRERAGRPGWSDTAWPTLGARLGAGRRRHRPGLVRAGARGARRRARSAPAWSGCRPRSSSKTPARRAEGRRTPDLRAGRGRALLLPARPRVAAARRRHARGSRAR